MSIPISDIPASTSSSPLKDKANLPSSPLKDKANSLHSTIESLSLYNEFYAFVTTKPEIIKFGDDKHYLPPSSTPKVKKCRDRHICKPCASYLQKQVAKYYFDHSRESMSEKTINYEIEHSVTELCCSSLLTLQVFELAHTFIDEHSHTYERIRRLKKRVITEGIKESRRKKEDARKNQYNFTDHTENSYYNKNKKKRDKFEPQGLFDVSLDQSSRQFLTDFLQKIIDGTHSAAEGISKYKPTVNVKFDFMNSVKESLNHLYEWFKGLGVLLKNVVSFLFELLVNFVTGPLKSAIKGILVYLGILDQEAFIGPHIDDTMSGTALEDDEEKGNMDGCRERWSGQYEPQSKTTLISLGFASLLYSKYLKWFLRDGEFFDLMSFLKGSLSFSSAMSSYIEPLYEFFCNLLNRILETFGIDYKIDCYWFRENGEKTYMDRFEKIYYAHKKQEIAPDELADIVFLFRDDVLDYISKLPSKSSSATILRLNTLLRSLQPILDEVESQIAPDKGPRQEPLSIMIAGPPGTGKSMNTQPILYSLIGRLISPNLLDTFKYNKERFVFFRESVNDYWEGYMRSVFAICYDDFAALKDGVGTPNRDVIEWMKLRNLSPAHLHMAAMAAKGGTYAHPKLLFGSTNKTFFDFQSIIDNEAVTRRIDVGVLQVPKLQYCMDPVPHGGSYLDRRLDPRKVAAVQGKLREMKNNSDPNFEKFWREHDLMAFELDDPFTPFPQTIHDMVEWDFKRGHAKKGGRVLSFDEFIEISCSKFQELQNKYKNLVKMNNAYVDKAILSRREDQIEQKIDFNPNPKLSQPPLPEEQKIFLEEKEWNKSVENYISEEPMSCQARFPFMMKEEDQGSIYRTHCNLCGICINGSDDLDILKKLTEHQEFCVAQSLDTEVKRRRSLHTSWFKWTILKFNNFFRKVSDKFLDIAWFSVQRGIKAFSGGFMSKLKEYGKYIVYLIATIGSTYLLYKGVKGIISSFSPTPLATESGPPGERSNREKAPKVRVKGKQVQLTPQSGTQNNTDFMNRVLKRSQYAVRLKETQVVIGFALFVVGTTFVVPSHFNQLVTARENLSGTEGDPSAIVEFLLIPSKRVAFSFDWLAQHSVIDGNKDFMFMKILPNLTVVRNHKDLVGMTPDKHGVFMSEKDARTKDGYTFVARVPVFVDDCLRELLVNGKFSNKNETYRFKLSDGTYDETNIYESNRLKYTGPTKSGDCGTSLFADGDAYKTPTILGIHTGGRPQGPSSIVNSFLPNMISNYNCVGYFLSKELILLALSKLQQEATDDTIDEQISQLANNVHPPDNFCEEPTTCQGVYNGFAKLGNGPKRTIPSKTKVKTSPLYDRMVQTWPALYAPAILKPVYRDGVQVHPLLKAQAKYLHDEFYVDTHLLGDVLSPLQVSLLQKKFEPIFPPRVFTMKEAIDGLPGISGAEGIARDTSMGIPDVLGSKTKTQILGRKGEFDDEIENFQEVKADVLDTIEKGKKLVRKLHLYIDCLKDERRLLQKVKDVSTRQFMACSMRYLIPFKMYFGDFIRQMQEPSHRIYNGIAVGINVYTEWWKIVDAAYDRVKDPVFIAGDFARYDGKLRATIMGRVLSIIQDFYSYGGINKEKYEADNVRRTLFEDIMNSLHLVEGIIYMFCGGMASGNPITAILNSIVTLVMCYMAIKSIMDDHKLEFNFWIFFVLAFGDDNIIAIPRGLSPIINQSTIAEKMMVLFDLEYTSEDKTTIQLGVRSITEITFLKRGFRLDDDTKEWTAPLDLDVLKETLKWQRDGVNPTEFLTTVECTLYELTLHGRKVFSECAPVILDCVFQAYPTETVKGTTYEKARAGRQGLY